MSLKTLSGCGLSLIFEAAVLREERFVLGRYTLILLFFRFLARNILFSYDYSQTATVVVLTDPRCYKLEHYDRFIYLAISAECCFNLVPYRLVGERGMTLDV